MRNSPYLFALVTLSTLAAISTVKPAIALPGQSANELLQWAKSRPLPTLKYSSEVYSYTGNKGNLHFYAATTAENGKITREGITVSRDRTIKFSMRNSKAVKLIESIYGLRIAKDFKNSQFRETVGRNSFLRGKYYAYSVAKVQDGTNFQIFPLQDLSKEISVAKYCQTHQCDI
jgi:hypothetical protein